MSDASATRDTTKKTNRKKWVLILAVTVALAGGAAAATRLLIHPAGDGSGAEAAAARQAREHPKFVALDQFTVNLADQGGERLAQIAVTLEVADDQVSATIKARMPAVRNAILLLISSKQTSDLLSVDGKKQLAQQIALQAGNQLGWQAPVAQAGSVDTAPGSSTGASSDVAPPTGPGNPIAAVHFSHFIVQ